MTGSRGRAVLTTFGRSPPNPLRLCHILTSKTFNGITRELFLANFVIRQKTRGTRTFVGKKITQKTIYKIGLKYVHTQMNTSILKLTMLGRDFRQFSLMKIAKIYKVIFVNRKMANIEMTYGYI